MTSSSYNKAALVGEGTIVQAGTVTGGIHIAANSRLTPIPRQLPAAPRSFTGRSQQLHRLSIILESAEADASTAVCTIVGAGGIGKTWLALHWAHKHLDRFPDGHLFVDLHGFTPTGQPTPPDAVVRNFILAFGVEPSSVPIDVEAQIALYRSLTADKRMLIILDNARNAAQVIPLLPTESRCLVLVTSRDQLINIVVAHGAQPIMLAVLSENEGRQILETRLGSDRLDNESAATSDLLSYCAGLPLALSVVASRAIAFQHLPLGVWAEELRDVSTRLGALDEDDPAMSLSAVLSWSYNALLSAEASVFRLLGVTTAPDINILAVANLSALPIAQAAQVVRTLERASLVQQYLPGRYRMHDLVRLYAANLVSQKQYLNDRNNAIRRLVNFYVHTAVTGERLLYPYHPPIELDPPEQDLIPPPLTDHSSTMAWFEAEYECLLSIQQDALSCELYRAVWQLAWGLHTFQWRRGLNNDQLSVWQQSLIVCERSDEITAKLVSHRRYGNACVRMGMYNEAVRHLHRALTLAESAADMSSQAHAHRSLATTYAHLGDINLAFKHATRALEIFRNANNHIWHAEALTIAGRLQAQLGDYVSAKAECENAVRLFREHRHNDGEAIALDVLADLAQEGCKPTEALTYLLRALVLRREVGDTYHEANALDRLGFVYTALGQPQQAREAWNEAMIIYQAQLRADDAGRIQGQLDRFGYT